jgi:hypothetical protein
MPPNIFFFILALPIFIIGAVSLRALNCPHYHITRRQFIGAKGFFNKARRDISIKRAEIFQ